MQVVHPERCRPTVLLHVGDLRKGLGPGWISRIADPHECPLVQRVLQRPVLLVEGEGTVSARVRVEGQIRGQERERPAGQDPLPSPAMSVHVRTESWLPLLVISRRVASSRRATSVS
jgi:hypothetical protein